MKHGRGYSAIGLDNPKSNHNVGAALRACDAFSASMLAISNHRYNKSVTDTTKRYRHMPLLQVDDLKTIIPYDCVPIAVELIDGATDLASYKHPQRAFYIFGAEDATLGKRTLSWCRDAIYIPTNCCLNLAACVNVVLYDRMVKE